MRGGHSLICRERNALGGYGSGWQRPKKTTVEDCLVLSMATFVRKQALVPGARTRSAWGWWREGEKDPYARLGYEVDASDPEHAWLRLDYRVNGTPWTTGSGW